MLLILSGRPSWASSCTLNQKLKRKTTFQRFRRFECHHERNRHHYWPCLDQLCFCVCFVWKTPPTASGFAERDHPGKYPLPRLCSGDRKGPAAGNSTRFLPAYSPNLNLIERLWKFVKREVVYNESYPKYEQYTKKSWTDWNRLVLPTNKSWILCWLQKFSPSKMPLFNLNEYR